MRPRLLVLAASLLLVFLLLFWRSERDLLDSVDTRESRAAHVLPRENASDADELQPIQFRVSPSEAKVPDTDTITDRERRRESADRAAHTAILEDLFGALLDELQLTADERLQFLFLMVEARRSAMDAIRVGRAASLNDREAFAKLVREAAMSTDADLLSLLGEQRFKLFTEYRSSQEGRTTARLLQAQLSGSAHELSETQSAELIRLYTQTQSSNPRYHPEVAAILQATGTDLSDRILSALAPVLRKEQFEALTKIRDDQAARHQAQKEYAERARSKNRSKE